MPRSRVPSRGTLSRHESVPNRLSSRASSAAAQLVGASVASLSPPSESALFDVHRAFMSSFLQRVLGESGLSPSPDAAAAAIVSALKLSKSPGTIAVSMVAAEQAAVALGDAAEKTAHVGVGTRVIREVLIAELGAGVGYDARVREVLLRMASAMRMAPRVLYDIEKEVLDVGLSAELDRERNASGERGAASVEDDASEKKRKRSRWLKIGGAAVVGGMAVGLSGGMLAPALLPTLSSMATAAGIGSIGASGASAIVGMASAAGAGLGGAAMANRTGAVEEFEFERCVVVERASGGGSRGTGIVTPSNPTLKVVVQPETQSSSGSPGSPSGRPLSGGASLLVYAFETWQTMALVVPAAVVFGVHQGSEWVVQEEELDAGGRESNGRPKRQRHTGAVTVLDSSSEEEPHALSWRLRPGSLATNISYRVAWVPCGHQMPPWLLSERESADGSAPSFHRAPSSSRSVSMSCFLFVPGLLRPDAEASDPGIVADLFCGPEGVVDNLQGLSIEAFALRWETRHLVDLSRALQNLGRHILIGTGATKTAAVVAPTLMAAAALPVALLGAVRSVIDNIWAKVMDRAKSAGLMLAAEIASRGFGQRPLSLVGVSIGCVIVFVALEELAERGLLGLVHDCFLIGAPVPSAVGRWETVRSVVSGRFVNVYHKSDWYLEFLSRGTNFTESFQRVAGTSPVLLPDAGVENVDVCELGFDPSGHAEYSVLASDILVAVGCGNGDRKRTWPWSWSAAEDSPPDRPTLDLPTLDLPLVDNEETLGSGDAQLSPTPTPSPLPSPSPSTSIPPSPPVVVFTNRKRRGAKSLPPRPT